MCVSLILSSFAGISFARPKKAEAEEQGHTLSNPRIVADNSMQAKQKVTWDCIWFGSYPQAEVVPASEGYTALSKELLQDGDLIKDDGLYQTLQAATGWDEKGDIVISGDKYRRIKKEDATYISTGFACYQWKGETEYHYFKYQPIKWRVLSVNGSEAFLLADQALDDKQYHTVHENVTWEGSTIRSWLNGYGASANLRKQDYSSRNFINTAFSPSARKAIKDTKVENKDNLGYGTDGGKDTVDKMFLLSKSEVYTDNAKGYGFVSDDSVHDEARRAKSSVYAKALGTWSDGLVSHVENCWWWLRSPLGRHSSIAARVYSDGWVDGYDASVDDRLFGIRPALNLNLADAGFSNLWSYAGTVCSDGTVDENGEIDYSYCFSIAGELQEVDSANETIKIDGITYKAFSDSSLTDAKNILGQHDNKIVACRVRAADHKIVRIDDVKDIIGNPQISIEPEIRNITYENGKFSKKSFRVDLYMSCGIQEPYTISDISDVVNKVDGLGIAFSKLSLTTSYNDTGRFAFLLKDGLLASQETTLEKKLDFKLKPGQIKKISVTVYVKEDSFSNENVNADASIEAKINDDEKTRTGSCLIHLSNLDSSREKEQKKLAASPKSTELNKASNILNGIQAAYTELDLKKCLTDTEVRAISAQVYNWIYTINALNVIINDDSGRSVLKKLLKEFGLTKEALQNKILIKMGIDKNIIPWMDSYTGTLQFEAKDKNTGKKITIKFTADMSLYTLGGSAYAGWGTLKYKISSGGSGKGQIAYTSLDSFIESLKKVVDSQMHNCYNKIYADGINETFNESVADSLISSTFGKLVNGKYGSASEAVYTGLKSAFTGYTEEEAKKSVKDIAIILTKDAISRSTEVSLHCPVDVTVYDGDGNICAEIKDDVVNEKYQHVAAYVNGEAKYLLLPDVDYTLCYSGSDTGTMDYTVTEYENGEAVRELIYNDVPLTTEKKYVNYLISGRHQGISLYNLNQVDGGIVEAASDIDKTKVQEISAESIALSDNTLSLKKGENYILMETIFPDNASVHDLIWSSSNDAVVEVSNSGILYAKADGEAVITVKINGRNLFDLCRVTVGEGNTSSPTPGASLAPSATPSVLPTLAPSEEPSDMPSNTPEVTPSGELAITPEPSIVPEPLSTPKADNKKNPAKSLKKGAMVSDSKTKAVNKITGTGKSKTVEYVRSTRKNVSKITIPAKVKLKGQNYKVTAIAQNAMKNSKKLSYVIIGKNVKKIGKKAFYGCKKLRYIYVKSKKLTAKNIGKQAFGNGYNSPRVKSAKSVWRRYARTFPSRGLSKRAVYMV